MRTSFEGFGDQPIRLAMIGMVDGNGHPYSWSAIFNGYDPDAMAACPYTAIPDYLGKEPFEAFGFPGVSVSHIWTDKPEDALRIAGTACIPHVVDTPEAVIGAVDAVIVATDMGHEHVDRCRPFVEAGLPLFVDKPLVDSAADLAVFRAWVKAGHAILSGSALSYAKEFAPYRASTHDLGVVRHVCITTAKSWERYGIHALSAVYPILGPGFRTVRNTGTAERNVVHCTHVTGVDVTVVAIQDMYGGFGCLQLCGTHACAQSQFHDTFYAFRAQLADFVHYLRTGQCPIPWATTEELMKLVIAGTLSREKGGREIALDTIG